MDVSQAARVARCARNSDCRRSGAMRQLPRDGGEKRAVFPVFCHASPGPDSGLSLL
jgi:hypothetical protein